MLADRDQAGSGGIEEDRDNPGSKRIGIPGINVGCAGLYAPKARCPAPLARDAAHAGYQPYQALMPTPPSFGWGGGGPVFASTPLALGSVPAWGSPGIGIEEDRDPQS